MLKILNAPYSGFIVSLINSYLDFYNAHFYFNHFSMLQRYCNWRQRETRQVTRFMRGNEWFVTV